MNGPIRTFGDCLTAAVQQMTAAGLAADEARQSAWVLAARAACLDRAGLLARLRDPAPPAFTASFDPLVARRATREPVAYILGEREFYGRPFIVTRDVLIPRPETELVVEEALQAATGERPSTIVDVGTGSGCLAITMALECPWAQVIATEPSPLALDVARANARRLGVAGRVTFKRGEYLDGVAGHVDLIVSNPPYVPDVDRPTIAPDVLVFEPAGALFAGPDGLDMVRQLVPAAARALATGGRLVLEIGHGQIDEVRRIIGRTGRLVVDRVRLDLQHIPRVVVASASGPLGSPADV